MSIREYIRETRKEIHPAFLIARREVRDQFSDWRVIFPIVILTASSRS